MNFSTVHERKDCRLCFSKELELAVELRPTPIGDAYVRPGEPSPDQSAYPMSLFLCKSCGHLQLPHVVDPSVLYRKYTYRTAHSPGLVEHFRKYASEVISRIELKADALVVEIGSNDGSLLKAFAQSGMRVLGVDPATGAAEKASDDGIETLPDFFNLDLARKIRGRQGPAKVIAANNVYAHIDDIDGVTQGIAELLDDEGVFIFEVSYLLDVLVNKAFDTFYLEHLSHHSIIPLVSFFDRHGLEIFDVKRNKNKGGTIRCYVQKRFGIFERAAIVNELVSIERMNKLNETSTFLKFSEQLKDQGLKLCSLLDRYKDSGRRLIGFGASNPITTIIYQFQLGERLKFLCDENPEKLDWKSPGYLLPVLSPEVLNPKNDVLVILAWNYADSIMSKYRSFAAEGGIFVVPLPEIREVSN